MQRIAVVARNENSGVLGAANNYRAGVFQISHNRRVVGHDHGLEGAHAIGGGVAGLVGIDLDGHRHAMERASGPWAAK